MMEPMDWFTLGPFALGATLGLGAWAINLRSGITVAVSLILMLVSVGIYFQRLLFDWGEKYARAVRDWQREKDRERDNELDRLYLELKEDGDPRTEVLLKDLRTLTKTLMSEKADNMAAGTFDLLPDVDRLFESCVGYLEESLQLWKTAATVERKSISTELLAQREVLISEVEKSLDRLGEVLGGIKRAAVSRDGEELTRLREELKTRLRIAEDVEARMRTFGTSVSRQDEEIYLKHANK